MASPPVTIVGIQNLITRLVKEGNDVQTSRRATPQQKADINNRILELTRAGDPKGLLVVALERFPFIDWNPIAAKFQALTPLLLAATDQGACRYQSGNPPQDQCIMTTRTQCEDLGGSFSPGQDCP